MNLIYITDISKILESALDKSIEYSDGWYGKAYTLSSPKRRDEADKFRIVNDKIRCLASGLLLEYAWRHSGVYGTAMPSILYGNHGKPYFENSDICFSISHSGNYVCVAISDKPVGVDIQKHIKLKMDIARRFYAEEEKEYLSDISINAPDDYEKVFFDLWSLKEGFIKCTGYGLSQGLNTFSMVSCLSEMQCYDSINNDRQYFIQRFNETDGYSLSVVGETNSEFSLIKVSATDILNM